ncbi:MAG: ABC transporter permease [Actinomycetota bacterium]|nr:ABC transporter permease [Actinomycetota bacterium]
MFSVASLTPGDPAEEYAQRVSDRPPTPEQLAAARHELRLDRPFVVQYVSWVGHGLRGDLGKSFFTRRPVVEEIVHRIPFTLQLAVPAAVLSLLLAIAVGTLCAFYRNRLVDQVVRMFSLAGASMPSFWLALILIIGFAVRHHIFPVAGRQAGLSSVVLPVVALSLPSAAVLGRFIRSTLLEVLGEDYIRTARSKGAREVLVLRRHALRNSLVPVVTAFGTSLGHLLAGTVVIETIFAWPGLGTLTLDAIRHRDYPMLQAFILFSGFVVIAINLIVDVSYAAIDPRIRPGRMRTAST